MTMNISKVEEITDITSRLWNFSESVHKYVVGLILDEKSFRRSLMSMTKNRNIYKIMKRVLDHYFNTSKDIADKVDALTVDESLFMLEVCIKGMKAHEASDPRHAKRLRRVRRLRRFLRAKQRAERAIQAQRNEAERALQGQRAAENSLNGEGVDVQPSTSAGP